MDFNFDDNSIITDCAPADAVGAGSEGLMDKNFLTTAGVLVAAGGGVAGTALLVTALPAQTLTAAAVSGGLIYAGDRKHKGLPIIPQFNGNAATLPLRLPPLRLLLLLRLLWSLAKSSDSTVLNRTLKVSDSYSPLLGGFFSLFFA